MDRVFAYFRVSTKEQKHMGTDENQRNHIREYSKGKYKIVKEFSDLGVSGAERDRPGFTSMVNQLHQVDGIIVYDLDRLSRDFEIGLMLMFQLKENRKKLICSRTDSVTDFSRSEDQLIHVIKSWVSEQERVKIKARQMEGIARYRAKNKRWGRYRKTINWKAYDKYRSFGIPRTSIAKMMGMSTATLWKLIKEREST